MGLWRNIQKGAGMLIRTADPDVREAKAAVKAYMAVASKRQDELNTTLRGIQEIADIGSHIGKDTDKRIADAKAKFPIDHDAYSSPDYEKCLTLFKSKLRWQESLMSEFMWIKNNDDTGFSALYLDARNLMNDCQTSPTETLYREQQLAMLNALSKCKIHGNPDVADKLRQKVDIKQSIIDGDVNELTSTYRSASESLKQNDPQTIVAKDIQQQKIDIEFTGIYINGLEMKLGLNKWEWPEKTSQPQEQVEAPRTGSPSM